MEICRGEISLHGGKRRRQHDFDDEMMSMVHNSAAEMVCSQQRRSAFPATASNSVFFNHVDPAAAYPSSKRLCNGVSSLQAPNPAVVLPTQPIHTYHQEVPTLGADSKMFLDSPPLTEFPDPHPHHTPNAGGDNDAVSMDMAEHKDMAPSLGYYGRPQGNAVHNVHGISHELQGVGPVQNGFEGSHHQQSRVCLRCLAGEPGHITHILGCVG